MKLSLVSKNSVLATMPLIAFGSPSLAQPSRSPLPTNSSSVHPLVQAIAESEDLSIEDTLELLDKQYDSRETLKKAQERAGVHFAGGWISEKESPVIAVNSTSVKHGIEAYGIVNAKNVDSQSNPIYHSYGQHIYDVEQRLGVSIVTR